MIKVRNNNSRGKDNRNIYVNFYANATIMVTEALDNVTVENVTVS